jgi:hypothetical protein
VTSGVETVMVPVGVLMAVVGLFVVVFEVMNPRRTRPNIRRAKRAVVTI